MEARPDRGWYLEGYVGRHGRLVRVPLTRFPFVVGRGASADLRLRHREVSSEHAALVFEDGRLWVEDRASTNGTRVNRRPVRGRVALDEGDVIHFARAEFRLGRERPEDASIDPSEETATFLIRDADLPGRFPANPGGFRELLEGRRLSVAFQPIVHLDDGTTCEAVEALARHEVAGLPERPDRLLEMAAAVGEVAALSRLMRERAAEEAQVLPGRPRVFVNTHPGETRDRALLESLESLRDRWPGLRLVLEVHEAWVTDLAHMRALARDLDDLGVGLAYDDFGAGRSRLLELVEAPPAWLKFDRALVAGLPDAPAQKVRMVETLVQLVRDWGITAVAEGVETAEEAALCARIGFHWAQGFLFGRPEPADRLAARLARCHA